ncbi:MAG: hypothetical protein IKC40_04240, partial [Oscillospiraceae bacterium]|nr:hypothetical protein [Oscillospiraceae bacterium]
MKTYDEIVNNVIEATAAHRRRVKHIQTIAATSAMCAACVLGLGIYLNLEPPQTLPEPPDETQTSTIGTTNAETDNSTKPHTE